MKNTLLRTDEEFNAMYQRHINMVYRICFSFMKNTVDTEDAVQETFLKLLNNPKRFENVQHEKAWLIVVASNVCKNLLKHWWHRRERIEDYGDMLKEMPVQKNEIFELVMNLPDKYKAIVYMYYYEGYNSAEIAKILCKPKSTVRNYLCDARKVLKLEMGGEFSEK